jgi:hypothetical protein
MDASRMAVVAKKMMALLMQLCLTNHSLPENYMLDKYKRRKGQQQVASWIRRPIDCFVVGFAIH